MMKNNLKICFVGLYDEKNFGDPIIAHCTEWLYSQHLQDEYTMSHLCLDYVEKHNLPIIWRGIRKIMRMFGINWIKYNDAIINKEYIKYFRNNIKCADLIVIVGGGLIKYTYQYFYAGISGLMDAAEKYGIPVVINAVGVEGYDASNAKCIKLKTALHRKALRHITTRDDIQTLYNCYFDGKPSIPCLKVADPAVWTAETYGITRKQSSVIGIGIGRGDLFVDNGIEFSKEQFFSLYVQLIEAVSK
ncbi:MAG: polysaccharide pyruvyl transferase family protein [Prevotella sp.]|nr:polysaccharide pyruvyl transferase family protein [Prevotella sp.]